MLAFCFTLVPNMFAKNQAHSLNQIPVFQFPAYFTRAVRNASLMQYMTTTFIILQKIFRFSQPRQLRFSGVVNR